MAKGFGGNFLKQAQGLQERIAKMQASLKEKMVEGTAGGGMVTTYFNGQQELVSVKIDKSVVDPDDVEMLEDLVAAAVTQGLKQSRELAEREMARVTGGLNLPGLT
jgi:DNA-binding YbaB/EbfC family protein